MDHLIALVTGANRGIGFELCRQLARKGHTVILTSRDSRKGHNAAEELKKEKADIHFIPLDVSDSRSVNAAAQEFKKQFSHLNLLINCAGILEDYQTPAMNVPVDEVRDTLNTNTLGPLRVCQAFVPFMTKPPARIINISSGMGQLSDMGSGALAYRVSKTALNAVTKILANELAGRNIHVNAVCPGWVKTDMGGKNATRSVENSVTGILNFLLADEFPTGKFVRDSRILSW